MNKNNIRQAILLNSFLQGQDISAYGIEQIYSQYLKLSKSLSKIDTQNCNGTISEELYTKKVNAIYTKLDTLKDTYNIHYYHQGDPRGVALYIAKIGLTQSNYNNGVAIC
jgi:hypothetical protein